VRLLRRHNDVMARYTFGDGEPARARLAVVAGAYEPVSRAFLAAGAPLDAELAVDLGCGPGFSTELIAATCRPRTLVGLDSSEHFLAMARALVPNARFVRHDVTDVPLPTGPADVIYARLVLAHLPDPPAVLERWRQQLARGGVVLSEELEAIESPDGPLREYDDLSARMVHQGGGVMCAGPLLAGLGGRCARVEASAALAARIYLFNVRLWLEDAKAGPAKERLLRLERDLADLGRAQSPAGVTWIVRQTVVSR
jgi:trans-aconitate 2-methyltransferase